MLTKAINKTLINENDINKMITATQKKEGLNFFYKIFKGFTKNKPEDI